MKYRYKRLLSLLLKQMIGLMHKNPGLKFCILRYLYKYPILVECIYRVIRTGNKFRTSRVTHLARQDSPLPLPQPRRIFLDISSTRSLDPKTGIQRVARGLLLEFLQLPIPGYRVEPVYLCNEDGDWHYKYAHQYILTLLNSPADHLQDDRVEPHPEDCLLILDLSGWSIITSAASGLYSTWQALGVKIYSLVYDLLPLSLPQTFLIGADILHTLWLKTIIQFDGAVCISQAVATEFAAWLEKNEKSRIDRNRPYQISWSHLGADIQNSAPTRGIPTDADFLFNQISKRPSFLMVGTIEPRKMHLQVIEAFAKLWQENVDINLIIVGAESWTGFPTKMRRNVPETVNCLHTHPEHGQRLFWLTGVSDEFLEKIYAACSCLIIASAGEGFGLPLIEAARQKLPIIARDLPVFREIGGDHAYYFSGTAADLADAIKIWLDLYDADKHPRSEQIQWLTWKQSAENILSIILPANKGSAHV